MKSTYIFGHRNPDTDSVCSSISLSYLKNELGLRTRPRVLGHINKESQFVLDYFGVKEPEYLNNVSIQIRSVNYNKDIFVYETDSIHDCFSYMQKNNVNALPIVDKNRKLTGFITLKEIAMLFINGDKDHLQTTLSNLVDALDGKVILNFHDEIKGNVLAGSYYSNTFMSEIDLCQNSILLVGDRYKIIKHAIDCKIQCIVITGGHELPEDIIESARENKVTIITTPLNTYNTANAITMSNYVKSLNLNKTPIKVYEKDYLKDFYALSSKTGHTNYPVVNQDNVCMGLLKVTDASKFVKRSVILVDHNNFAQSVPGIEDADIVEIIDHHNLGAIGTSMPINFRSKPVGCTCTIIFELYEEANVTIPKEIAGIMLSAILSDTLLFKSPTCTEKDIEVANKLAVIADINAEEYGMKMLKEASSIKGMEIDDIIFQDFKAYNVEDKRIGIAQVITMDYEEVEKNMDQYLEKLNSLEHEYDAVTVFITDIIKNGSYVLYNKEAEEMVRESFELDSIHEGTYLDGVVSRKKQMLPNLMENIGKLN